MHGLRPPFRQSHVTSDINPSRSLSMILGPAIAILLMSWTETARAQSTGNTIASVVTVCTNCSTFEQLQARARSYFGQFSGATPPGYSPGRYVQPCEESEYNSQTAEEVVVLQRPACTIATVVSDTFPLSATFELTRVYTDNTIGVRLFLISPLSAYDTETAFRHDEETFGRVSAASAIPDIELPAQDPSGNTIEPGDHNDMLSPSIAGTIELIGPATGTTIVNALWTAVRELLGLPNTPSAAFNFRYNSRIYTLYVGQAITVKYSNGWTEKFRFQGLSTLMWKRVPGTLRDAQGNKPEQSASVIIQPAAGVAVASSVGGIPLPPLLFVPVEYSNDGSRFRQRGIVIITQLDFHAW